MGDAPLPEQADDRHDYVHIRPPRISIKRDSPTVKPSNRLGVIVAIGSLLLQLGSIAWIGGRVEQKVTEHGEKLAEHTVEIKEIRKDVGGQSRELATANAAYSEILRRLQAGDERATRIEGKIDQLRGRD